MFTGIVEEAGEVRERAAVDDGRRLRIAASFASALVPGQSVSVGGACLTVEEADESGFTVFLSTETLERTALDRLTPGDSVNLERALAAGDRLDGHIVQGHVDATGEVLAIDQVADDDWEFTFSLPGELSRYVVEKGSIAVDGISLTVASRAADRFSVAVIPTTYELTTLAETAVGEPVHLEVDVLAKYVDRLMDGYEPGD